MLICDLKNRPGVYKLKLILHDLLDNRRDFITSFRCILFSRLSVEVCKIKYGKSIQLPPKVIQDRLY